MSVTSSTHFKNLNKAYNAVGNSTWCAEDFLESNLDISKKLFTPESLVIGEPLPKKFEVYALLSGLSFPAEFSQKLVQIQRQISYILDDCLHYWVKPKNLGLEYCVFKWPEGALSISDIESIQSAISSKLHPSFTFSIYGVQINPDGCVVAKGYDHDAALFQIRDYIKNKISFLPKKQSGWAHVPLGRILAPVGSERFIQLSKLINSLSNKLIVATEITSMKFVHETRWYMEEKSIISEYPLNPLVDEVVS
ncbi:hypothetical protein [Desulfoluna butyratoxydans]|uniref:2'-5' RNA ligase family protein n=1 Tax=Desulfoluna butyratoxydans TaxID=231438 RepID=A0A4U8YRN8_9BACT|nr:hypothetical protein [Desulfoluna butyratoxydans]VFQ46147.1 hypothetical protein MSL71_38100 [Desulfoluna butyratoxydans]